MEDDFPENGSSSSEYPWIKFWDKLSSYSASRTFPIGEEDLVVQLRTTKGLSTSISWHAVYDVDNLVVLFAEEFAFLLDTEVKLIGDSANGLRFDGSTNLLRSFFDGVSGVAKAVGRLVLSCPILCFFGREPVDENAIG